MATQITDLTSLLVYELQDLYNAEQQLLEALPEMERTATHNELKSAFRDHHRETQRQVERLEEIFTYFEAQPTGEKCEAMEGLLKEAQEVLEFDAPDDVKDAALIAASQRIEHYEIAGYGTAKTYARHLGLLDIELALHATLREESAADEHLSQLAIYKLNREAMATA
ncbi:MAG: ferritin-like domain-containing protein [Phycisphaeraceae bacterium]